MPLHEIRDPIHTFIRVDSDERMVVDSAPVQRLRHIHQLAMTCLVYPGATHRRFEHSLGVMELAGRVFDVVTAPGNLDDSVRKLAGDELDVPERRLSWRRALRIAALCHDIGHLPFSHAAERELLPEGWNHEQLTIALIRSPEMEDVWRRMRPQVASDDVVKLAVGPKELRDEKSSPWESLLSEIIVGDALGVDRMDYLLRDCLHAGVAYGRFDHFRLVDTLRILPSPGGSGEPLLGVEEGGLQSAEALLLARYFMFSQVYYHRVRRAYDIHLRDFLRGWLPGGQFSTDTASHLRTTDAEVTAALFEAARDSSHPGHDPARRIVQRQHFKSLWQRDPEDLVVNPDAGAVIASAAAQEFGAEAVRHDYYAPQMPVQDFPVRQYDDSIAWAQQMSQVLQNVPPATADYVFIRPDLLDEARKWLGEHKRAILEAGLRKEE